MVRTGGYRVVYGQWSGVEWSGGTVVYVGSRLYGALCFAVCKYILH